MSQGVLFGGLILSIILLLHSRRIGDDSSQRRLSNSFVVQVFLLSVVFLGLRNQDIPIQYVLVGGFGYCGLVSYSFSLLLSATRRENSSRRAGSEGTRTDD